MSGTVHSRDAAGVAGLGSAGRIRPPVDGGGSAGH